MLRFGRGKTVRRASRAGLLAGVVVAALGVGGLGAGSAVAAPSCTGSNIIGEGASLQKVAQQQVWAPGIATICSKPGLVTYEGPGSGNGLRAWDFNGPDGVPFDTSRAFTASDDAPSSTQIGNAEAASGSPVLVIPVAQTAIGVVVNPPENCDIEEITNQELQNVFAGTKKNWGAIPTAFGTGCAGSPITRIVRPVGSGTTYQFKNFLFQANKAGLACTEGSKTWQQLEEIGAGEKPNITWPENSVGGCSATQLSPIKRSNEPPNNLVPPLGTGGGDLVKKVNITDGSIGYAALPDIEGNKGAAAPYNNPNADTHWLRLQNNGLVKLANATMAEPLVESNNSANCGAAKYAVPANGRTGTGTGVAVDWSQVFGANISIGGEAYPLCTLTYDMSLTKYSNKAGFTAGQVTTVVDYLQQYITAATGQSAIENAEKFYAPLPTSTKPERNVLGAAQLSAEKIGF